ncbi:TRAP transporter substrate-binding protein [Litorivicinus sp.]|jgi:tripartite ATP-independent transporter DctP family solute receptor|nr:TRAP transporter substrate-binding protein [Litorivicinus sp.]
MRFRSLSTSLVVVSAMTAGCAMAADVTLKFGHVGKPGSLFEASVNAYAQCVADESNGKIEVQTYGSSQLGKDKELLQKLKLGQVDFALPSSVMSSVSDEFGVFEMPYIIKNREHMKRVQAKLGDTFQLAAQAKGYHIVGYFENGFRHITNNTRAINVPTDLKGIKLRTPKGAWRVKMFKLYGANPTPMAFSDVFTALKTGVIDGQENPYAQIASAKFQEVQKYLSITGHVYTPAYVLASKKHFDKRPASVRKVINACAGSTQTFVYRKAAALETELLDVIKAAGVKVNNADNSAFIKASKPIYDEFASSVDGGAKLIKAVQDLAN